jgi:hypothetical protein
VTINPIKTYNRVLTRVDGGDGRALDLPGPAADIHTYTVLMMLNPSVEHTTNQSMFQTCVLISLAQTFLLCTYFVKTNDLEDQDYKIAAIANYQDIALKFLIGFVMHLIVKPDMKQAIDLV